MAASGRLSNISPRLTKPLELAWHVALVNHHDGARFEIWDDARFLRLWRATRDFTAPDRWISNPQEQSTEADQLPRENALAAFFVADLLLRVVLTALATIELEQAKRSPNTHDPARRIRPILDRSFEQMLQSRHQALELLVTMDGAGAALDRLLRRCERWTDLLIGGWAVRQGVVAFAHQPARAWDFGEELAITGEIGVRLLRSSFESAFRGRLLATRVADGPLLEVIHLTEEWIGTAPESSGTMPSTVEQMPPDTCTLPPGDASVRTRHLLENALRRLRSTDSPDSNATE